MVRPAFDPVHAALSGALVGHVLTALTFAPPDALAAVSAAPRSASSIAEAASALDVDLAFVPSWLPSAPGTVAALREVGVAPAWVVRGPLWPTLEHVGLENGLRLTARDPDALASQLDLQVERSRSAVLVGMRLDVSAIVVAEDLAGNDGLLVAPDFALAEVVPRLHAVVAPAIDDGVAAVLHSDGDIRALLPALARAGFTAVHAGGGLSRDAFERLFWAARRLGFGVIGGISTGDLVTPAGAVFAGTSASLLARAGGLLIGDDGGVERAREMRLLETAFAAARSDLPPDRL